MPTKPSKKKKSTATKIGRRGPKKSTYLIFISILFIGVFVWFEVIVKKIDSRRFENARKDSISITNDLKKELQNKVLSQKEKNLCFNTEQGPFDNGRLWCQTAQVMQLDTAGSYDYDNLGSQFILSAKKLGKKTEVERHGSTSYYSFEYDHTMACSFGFEDSVKKTYGNPARNVLNAENTPSLSISCADRSKAAHYLYVD